MFFEIKEQWQNIDATFLLFRRIYDYCNNYTHCSLLDYLNRDGIYTRNISSKDLIEVLYLTNFIFSFYVYAYFKSIKLDQEDIIKKIVNNFYNICEEYDLIF